MLENWLILIVPIVSYFVTQGAKLAFDGVKGNTDVYHMWTKYGGMPSAHSAFVISLALYIGLVEGFANPLFAITIVFSIIIIRDAMGLRINIGQHAEVINKLIQRLPENERHSYDNLIEKMGHTPLEVFVGSVFGACIALLAYFFI